jgi:hypothetical protein
MRINIETSILNNESCFKVIIDDDDDENNKSFDCHLFAINLIS